MRSPRIGQARKTTTSGATKVIDTASATGTNLTAPKNRKVDISMLTELMSCETGCRVRNSDMPMRGAKNSTTTSRCMEVRAQTIC